MLAHRKSMNHQHLKKLATCNMITKMLDGGGGDLILLIPISDFLGATIILTCIIARDSIHHTLDISTPDGLVSFSPSCRTSQFPEARCHEGKGCIPPLRLTCTYKSFEFLWLHPTHPYGAESCEGGAGVMYGSVTHSLSPEERVSPSGLQLNGPNDRLLCSKTSTRI
eukprot:GHVO01011096.1.p2 GENE.GHVO01011096.1~~GHVO01011096.1.p2  ORF type:complete len:167 (+),score=17.49 GHVO01011096.1:80-580(+)